MKVEFYRHNIGPEEIAELTQTLEGIFLTTGPKTRVFEEAFAAYLGRKHALGFTSWTTAAFLVLKAWGIGEGDEVILPPMTFISAANIVLHCGATPVFVDVEPETGNLDVARVEQAITPATKAIIPVHLYGQMADMKALRALADTHGVKILEDCAHAIESVRDGYRPGALGDAAAFSFYATKNLACGEGGAVVTDDAELIETLRLLRLHGMSKSAADRYTSVYAHWDMELLGYKANMSDIQAALLIPQLRRLDMLWERREFLSRYYEKRFAEAGFRYPQVLPGSKSARHLFTVWVPDGKRDAMLSRLPQEGVGVAVNFRPVHLMKYYRQQFGYAEGAFPVAETLGEQTLTLPMYPRLTDAEAEYVADTVIRLASAL
jgi:UDP-4-amino-4-deoxy-L-arabinose-oxoglutarate aminotransferase